MRVFLTICLIIFLVIIEVMDRNKKFKLLMKNFKLKHPKVYSLYLLVVGAKAFRLITFCFKVTIISLGVYITVYRIDNNVVASYSLSVEHKDNDVLNIADEIDNKETVRMFEKDYQSGYYTGKYIDMPKSMLEDDFVIVLPDGTKGVYTKYTLNATSVRMKSVTRDDIDDLINDLTELSSKVDSVSSSNN